MNQSNGRTTAPFDDVQWLAEHATVVQALDSVRPHTVVSHTVTALRGALKPVPEIYKLYSKESQDKITENQNTQDFTEKEILKWVSLKQLKDHLKTFEPGLEELHKRRRASRPQKGFPVVPFKLTNDDKKLIMKHLILSLYVNQAPVRRDMADMFIYDGEVPEPHVENYLHCPNPAQRPIPSYTAVWSKYKTSKFLGTRTRVFKPLICKHVYRSLQLWPRQHLLSS